MAGKREDGVCRCSFCGKSQQQVKKLIAGPGNGVFICDECIDICNEILDNEFDDSDAAVDAEYTDEKETNELI